ncbi:TfoX/Sxy family protein [Maribacter sp. 2304DJ31-5]|uniref:TfoX/Sxy family protein n=1 Tax=Maribacter sp. 2304DJ31-5 TaxID=3386273 RepID=UPI0039BD793A
MGIKGDKITQGSVLAAAQLVKALDSVGAISSKKMFGGHGIFHKGKMFGIVNSKGTAYFKVNDTNRKEYEENGAQKHGKMPYFSIPESILNNPVLLLEWAKKALKTIKYDTP